MSQYPIALVLAIAAGREADLLTLLAGTLDVEPDNTLRVTVGQTSVRFAYRRVTSSDGVDTISIAAYPSSGTNGDWHLWIVQPYDPMPGSYVKAFRDLLRAWAAARQPTGGLWHLLGPYAPDEFRAIAPAAVWAAAVGSWWSFWRAESSVAGVTWQQAVTATDVDAE